MINYNNGNDCIAPDIYWVLDDAIEIVDYIVVDGTMGSIDTNGSDTLKIKFLNTAEYKMRLVANSLCSSDTSEHTSFIFDPVIEFGIDSISHSLDLNSMSFCGDTTPYIILSPESYNNLDTTTTFNISVYNTNGITQQLLLEYYAGFDDKINPDTLKLFNSNNLFTEGDTIFLDAITTSSCGLFVDDSIYNGSYKLEIIAQHNCDEDTINGRIYYSESTIADFEIDNPLSCHVDSIYTFTNTSSGLLNEIGSCTDPKIFWTINGEVSSSDWEIVSDSLEAIV